MKLKVGGYAIKLSKSSFGEAPKALNAVNVTVAMSKFIFAVIYSKVLIITNINKPIVATPSVRIYYTVYRHFAKYHSL